MFGGDMSIPGTDNPPGIYSLRLKGLNADANEMQRMIPLLNNLKMLINI